MMKAPSQSARSFELSLLPRLELKQEDTDNGRYYWNNENRYPSVTTVLGRVLNKDSLEQWKKRIGEEEANRIGRQACVRGSAIHELAESFLLNRDWRKNANPVNLATFLKIKPVLEERVGLIRGIELPVYSDRLKTAGRTDLLAEFDGKLSIIDFKTSKKIKKDKDILSYFLQTTCYGEMVEERYPEILVPQIVVVIGVDYEDTQVFVKPRANYLDQVNRVFIEGKL